jgi:hypothetical protein
MGNRASDRQVSSRQVTGNQSLGATSGAADYDIGRRNSKSWYERNLSPIFQDSAAAASKAATGGYF